MEREERERENRLGSLCIILCMFCEREKEQTKALVHIVSAWRKKRERERLCLCLVGEGEKREKETRLGQL